MSSNIYEKGFVSIKEFKYHSTIINNTENPKLFQFSSQLMSSKLRIKVKHFLSYTEMPYKCYHLFHNRENPDMRLYQRNFQLLQKFAAMSKEDLGKTINPNTLQKMGMKNKYDNQI